MVSKYFADNCIKCSQKSPGTLAIRDDGTEHLVSWQTAFYTLVPIAVNTMTQPSGMVCAAPTEIAPLLRSCPTVCIFDALLVFGRLVYHWIKEKSLTSAFGRLVIERFLDTPEEAKAPSWNELLLRWFLSLTAILLSIKLYALDGLVWTKVWAAMYLISFATVELLILVPRRWVPTKDLASRRRGVRRFGATSMPYVGVAVGSAFCLYYLIHATKDIAFAHWSRDLSSGNATGLVLGVSGAVAFTPPAIYSYRKCHHFEEVLPAFAYLSAVLVLPWFYYLAFSSPLLGSDTLTPTLWNVAVALMVAVWATLGLKFAATTFRFVVHDGRPTELSRPIEVGLGWYFLFLNLVTALLSYAYSYDSRGTYKPVWTEYLG